jgi:ABC-type sugar transport system ATPase subunit
MISDPILQAHGITKRFPGVVALSDVTFDLRPGEVMPSAAKMGRGSPR